jgi:hypothetical protein
MNASLTLTVSGTHPPYKPAVMLCPNEVFGTTFLLLCFRGFVIAGMTQHNNAPDSRSQSSRNITLTQKLTYSVKETVAASSLSQRAIWGAIMDGRLATVKVGRRRLVPAESLRKFLGISQTCEPQQSREAS